MIKSRFIFLILIIFSCASVRAEPVLPSGQGSYEDLVRLVEEFVAYRDPATDPGGQFTEDSQGRAIRAVVDVSDEALERRREAMAGFQAHRPSLFDFG